MAHHIPTPTSSSALRAPVKRSHWSRPSNRSGGQTRTLASSCRLRAIPPPTSWRRGCWRTCPRRTFTGWCPTGGWTRWRRRITRRSSKTGWGLHRVERRPPPTRELKTRRPSLTCRPTPRRRRCDTNRRSCARWPGPRRQWTSWPRSATRRKRFSARPRMGLDTASRKKHQAFQRNTSQGSILRG